MKLTAKQFETAIKVLTNRQIEVLQMLWRQVYCLQF